MTKRKWVSTAVLTVILIWAGLFAALKGVQTYLNRNARPSVVASDMTWDAPAFSFVDQDAKPLTNKDLLGHVWIADFFYSQCTSACPILTSKLLLLQKKLPMPELRFVSFSVDPEHDSPIALKKYAELWEGDQSRWRLLSTDPDGLSAVAKGMKVPVADSGDKDNPILHASQFFLVDTTGKVRGIYDSIDNQSLERLVEDAKSLAGGVSETGTNIATAGTTSLERGKSLYNSMGCVACHSQPRIAPPLQSMYGSIVRLDNRKMVWADEAYIHESIVNPNAKIVAGYAGTMPNYHSYLNDSQVMDLVAYIKSLSTNSPGGHGFVAGASTSNSTNAPNAPSGLTQPDAPELLIDPVCKMQVTSDPSAPHVTTDGRTWYFCSDQCKEKFLKNPGEFTRSKHSPP